MKNAILFFLSLTVFALFFTSCNKTPAPSSFNTLDQLTVNDNFSWQTARDVTFKITKNASGVMTISSADGVVIYHKGFYNGLATTYDVTVSIPGDVSRVNVNGKEVAISGNPVSVDLVAAPSVLKSVMVPLDEDMVAYWQFNEDSGSTVHDSKGKNNGAITGSKWASGINRSALKFNGTVGNVTIPYSSALDITGDKLSLSVWFKKSSANDDGAFVFCRTKYILRVDSHGKITFAIYSPGWHAVTIPWDKRIVDTDWHHLAAIYDGKIMKIYVDAVLLASAKASGKLKHSVSPVYMGSENPVNFFAGFIDEVAVFAKALTKEDVSQLYANTPNPDSGGDALVSWWKFNENSGSTAADSKGGNNGTIHGARWDTGVEGAALSFDGSKDYVTVPNAANLNVTNQITLMAWAKTMENKTCKVVEKGDWDGQSILQDHWNGWTAQIRTADNKSVSINWKNGIPVYGEWYHIAMTYDGKALRLFVNGQLMNSKAVTGKLHVNSRTFVIGSNDGSQKFFHGSIDDVRFFNKALSQTEIQAVFKNKDNKGNKDADGDGVADKEDAYPADPARAFNNLYPAAGFGSLAFEDLWPGKGDYDFNDLVLDYRFKTVTNVSNKVVDVIGTFVIRAIGAGQSNGFGFQLTGSNLKPEDITVSGSDLQANYINVDNNGLESEQEKPTIIVFDDANKVMPPEGGFGVNVEPDKPYVKPDTIVISIAFVTNKYSIDDIDIVRFNPFLIVNKTRGKEVHLPGYAPTSLVDKKFFGTMDDDSHPESGRYYKTKNNLPWVINISESFDYLIEKNEITTGYLKFYDWAASSGTEYPDWYKDKSGYRNRAVIYRTPD